VVVWDGPRANLSSDVGPGGNVSGLNINVTAPGTAGSYCLIYDLVREGVTWFSTQGASTRQVNVTVNSPQYGVTWGSHNTPSTMNASAQSTVSVSFTNAGSLTWASGGGNPVRLSYHWRSGACPGGSMVVWDGPRANLSADVGPGGNVSGLNIPVTAPGTAGSYCLIYDLVREGVTWFSTQGASTRQVNVTVQEAEYAVTWGSDNTPTTMTADSANAVEVSFTNAGSLTWESEGSESVRLSYHWRNGACNGTSNHIWNGTRAFLSEDISEGEAVDNLEISVIAPSAPGTYCLVYDLVHEGVTWFSTAGAEVKRVTVTVE
jgi:hypothetical protein